MRELELLAPARNAQIGIAAIDCGADSVYIAGPDFGARKDAHNPMEDIQKLCTYAHRFGARVFVTFNIQVSDGELPQLHSRMLDAQNAGADAFIIRDMRICGFSDITVPLHASTQCSIRDAQRASQIISCGCSRVVLERELSLDTVSQICKAVSPMEVEVFVHGALCVCYSGQCTLSEHLTGRSADRGECIQACRNLYDLQTLEGKVIAKNKAVLSLKDYNLLDRLEDLARAGATSFKIEGRLKNESYVRNTVSAYSRALDALVASHPDQYCRASFGMVRAGFTPDLDKTFNRGWTELFLDGKRGKWASSETPKSMGELLGEIESVKNHSDGTMTVTLKRDCSLSNGDGFAVYTSRGIVGFRGDVCRGRQISSKHIEGIRPGDRIWRNVSTAFEKEIESKRSVREIPVKVSVVANGLTVKFEALSQDGRKASVEISSEQYASNVERMSSMLTEGLCKSASIYRFSLQDSFMQASLPLLSSARINQARRTLAAELDALALKARPMQVNVQGRCPMQIPAGRMEGELMRSKYCIRYEFGLCPRTNKSEKPEDLVLLNNGRRLLAHFHCKECEMSISRS